MHVDEVGRAAGLPIAPVTSTLALMELKGLVRQVGGMNYVRAREAAGVQGGLTRLRLLVRPYDALRRFRNMLYAVIMAGGSGTRLWPLSRKSQPKQALKLIGERTMFQHAVDRLAPLFPPERIFVVTNAAMAEVLRPQTPDVPAENFILEPAGRDSAPAAGLAAVHLLQRDPDAIMVMLTADHYIVDTAQFRARCWPRPSRWRSDGTIVTLGIRPDLSRPPASATSSSVMRR